jgi:hypothetical protein
VTNIAKRFGVNLDVLVEINKATYPSLNKMYGLKKGTTLELPPPKSASEIAFESCKPDWYEPCLNCIRKLRKCRFAGGFEEPVDWEGCQIPSYPWIITNPMDLGTVERKLITGEYGSAEAFAKDVRLTLQNAMAFNPEPDDEIHVVCRALSVLRILGNALNKDSGTPLTQSNKYRMLLINTECSS